MFAGREEAVPEPHLSLAKQPGGVSRTASPLRNVQSPPGMNHQGPHRNNRHLTADETGSAAIEYAVIASIITMAVIGALIGLGGHLIELSDYMASELARAIDIYAP